MTENEHADPDGLAIIRSRFAPGWPPAINVKPGWYGLLVELDRALAAVRPGLQYAQIKTKFGMLNVYVEPDFGNEEMRALIGEAVTEARRTCEQCGSPGRMRVRRHWYRTLCDECVAADAGDARGEWELPDGR